MASTRKAIPIILVVLVFLTGGAWLKSRFLTEGSSSQPVKFNGQRALRDVQYQVSLGPRVPESPSHTRTVQWIEEQLKANGWSTQVQETTLMDKPIRNVIGKWGTGSRRIILGAHYDTRMLADQDPNLENRSLPVPGGNDGASGVAVLLELARVLPSQLSTVSKAGDDLSPQIWLVFFDAEDNGHIPGWDWIMGSRAFVAELDEKPEAVVIVDMIGDADLNIYQEQNSDPQLTEEIWDQAHKLGYSEQFIPTPKYRMTDDHTPFLEAGIRAVDLIDFDYPYWHTVADTADKVSAESLEAVGNTLIAWLTQK